MPELQSVVLGNYAFHSVTMVLMKDLPEVTSITLGAHACQFVQSLFELEDVNKMEIRSKWRERVVKGRSS